MADGTVGIRHPGPDRQRHRRRGDPPARPTAPTTSSAATRSATPASAGTSSARASTSAPRRATGAPTPTASPTAATATSSQGNTITATTVRGDRHQGGHDRRRCSSTTPSTAPGMTGADSWVDVKGNNWTDPGQHRRDHAAKDGFQTHQILDGWGDHNVFAAQHRRRRRPGLRASPRGPRSQRRRCATTTSPTQPRASATSPAPERDDLSQGER